MWRINGLDIYVAKAIKQQVLPKLHVKHWQNVQITASHGELPSPDDIPVVTCSCNNFRRLISEKNERLLTHSHITAKITNAKCGRKQHSNWFNEDDMLRKSTIFKTPPPSFNPSGLVWPRWLQLLHSVPLGECWQACQYISHYMNII